MLTIDANVFVSAASTTEIQYTASIAFFARILQMHKRIYCPTIVLPETVAGIIRPTNNSQLASITASGLSQLPGLTLVVLDDALASAASDIILQCRLRGADAIYLAVAQEYGTTLITWDQELLTRGPSVVPTMTPTDWLFSHPTG